MDWITTARGRETTEKHAEWMTSTDPKFWNVFLKNVKSRFFLIFLMESKMCCTWKDAFPEEVIKQENKNINRDSIKIRKKNRGYKIVSLEQI